MRAVLPPAGTHMKLLPLSFVLVVALSACTQPANTTPATDAAQATVAPAAVATVAQASDANSDADADANYDLTMANVDAWMAAQKYIAAAVDADASIDPAMNVSEEDGAQYAARLEATPALRDAITKAGISTRDYALTGEALIAALMAVGALDTGALKEIPEGLNPQNVEFVRANQAALEAKMKALQSQG
jgi:hypothetical protein